MTASQDSIEAEARILPAQGRPVVRTQQRSLAQRLLVFHLAMGHLTRVRAIRKSAKLSRGLVRK